MTVAEVSPHLSQLQQGLSKMDVDERREATQEGIDLKAQLDKARVRLVAASDRAKEAVKERESARALERSLQATATTH